MSRVLKGASTIGFRGITGCHRVGGPDGVTISRSNQRLFDGEIRGLSTYERALSPAEIQARYDAGLP